MLRAVDRSHELGDDVQYDDELDENYHVVRFPRLLPFSACVLTWWTVDSYRSA
jgi:hypothetical protein